MKKIKTEKILWLGILVFVLILGSVAVMRHYNFQTQTWDMGVFVQTFWNTTEGRMMFNNLEEAKNHLGVHMSPFLFLLAPFYFVFKSPYFLLIAQTIGLALGAWPLFLLARKVLDSSKWALLMAVGYLLYASVHWVNSFDFHAIAFFPALFLAGFYFLESKRWGWAALFLVLAAATKENAIIVMGFLGLYWMLRQRGEGESWFSQNRKTGLLIGGLSVLYFVLSVKVIMPALGGGLLRLDRYGNLGTSAGEIVTNLLGNPMLLADTVFTTPKLFYLLWILLPMAFLPLLSWRSWFLIIPGLAQNLLTSFEFQFLSFFQYDSILIPGVWIGAVYGLKIVLDRFVNREKAVFAVLLLTILGTFMLRSPVSPFTFPFELFGTNERWQAFRQMIEVVPEDVSVAAHTNLVPHLSHREHAYLLGHEPFAVDMVLMDTQDNFGFGEGEFQRYVDSYVNSGLYSAQAFDESGRYVILIRDGL